MAQTRQALTTHARALTAQCGLHGFTIDELCEHVGVSRRTFFNYFDAKEHAVIGHPLEWFLPDAVEMFLAMRPRGAGISTTLIDDLVALESAHIAAIGHTPDQARAFIAAVEREPALLQRMMHAGQEREAQLRGFIAQREGIDADDPIAVIAVLFTSSLIRAAGEIFFTPENTLSLEELLAPRLAAARTLFAGSTSR